MFFYLLDWIFMLFSYENRKKKISNPLTVPQDSHVHQEKRRMIHKAAVAFFLSRMEEYHMTHVPLLPMETNRGAHLILSTLESGPTVVNNIRWLFNNYWVHTTPQLFFYRCNVPK